MVILGASHCCSLDFFKPTRLKLLIICPFLCVLLGILALVSSPPSEIAMFVFEPSEVTLSYLIPVEMTIFLLIAPRNMEVSYSSAFVVYVVGWKKGDDV